MVKSKLLLLAEVEDVLRLKHARLFQFFAVYPIVKQLLLVYVDDVSADTIEEVLGVGD